MSDRDKDRPSEDPDPPPLPLDDLPPLDDGDLEPPALEAIEELVGADDGADDGALGLDDLSADELTRELADFEDAAGVEEVDDVGAFASDEVFEEGSEGWADAEEPAAPMDDPWFVDDLDAESFDDDGGAEGPVAEPDDPFWDADEGSEVQYLGPVRGWVAGIAVVDGALLAAGDGLYRVGADGLLHRYDAENEIDAVSVCAAGAAILLGTERLGLLRAEGFGRAVEPFGIWLDARCAAERRLPGPLAVFGAGAVLAGLTGDGELIASDDEGRTWRGPLAERRCLAAATWEGETAILALVDGEEGPALLAGDGRAKWWRPGAPCPIGASDRSAKISIAAAGGVIAIGSDRPGAPLSVSMDHGESFSEVAAVTGITAIAVDAREPGWIAAATWDPAEGVGAVRVSLDGGKTWRTAFATGRAEEREDPSFRPGRVTSLAVAGDDVRLLYAVTGEGVYSAPLPEGAAAH
jgi:hypothetical protein